eukprot:gene17002-biopygen15866
MQHRRRCKAQHTQEHHRHAIVPSVMISPQLGGIPFHGFQRASTSSPCTCGRVLWKCRGEPWSACCARSAQHTHAPHHLFRSSACTRTRRLRGMINALMDHSLFPGSVAIILIGNLS